MIIHQSFLIQKEDPLNSALNKIQKSSALIKSTANNKKTQNIYYICYFSKLKPTTDYNLSFTFLIILTYFDILPP